MGLQRVKHDLATELNWTEHILMCTRNILHKTSLSTFKKTEMVSSIFSNYNAVGLQINYKEKSLKKHKHMEAKQNATEQWMSHWRKKKTKNGNKRKWKHNNPKSMRCTKSSFQREVCSNSSFPQEIRKISHKQPICTPKGTRKRRTNKTQS